MSRGLLISAKTGEVIYDEPEQLSAEDQRDIAKMKRAAAYRRESDPLLFKWHAGEVDESEWLAKREEIRARYPYPEDGA